ncbi:MAG: multiheme c-type cytochrome, partial [Isosphaeraceae bacterium]
ILLRQSRLQDGEKLIRRSLELNPNYHEPARFLTQFGFQNRRYEDALLNSLIWAGHSPEINQARIFQARIYEAINQPQQAAESLQAILKADQSPNQSTSRVELDEANLKMMLARNLLRSQNPADALKIIESITSPEHLAEVSWLKSRCFLQMGQGQDAIKFLATAKSGNTGGFQPGQAEEPSPFAGAQSCRECHAEIYDEQQNSRHSQTFHLANDTGKLPWENLALPDPATPDISAKFDVTQSPPGFEFKSEKHEMTTLVKYILGSGRHAITPIIELKGQKPLYECRWTFYSSVSKWDLTPGQPAVPPTDIEFAGTAQTPDMLRLCLNCHTTNPTAILQMQGPEAQDRAIGCERCHGPGANHISAMKLKLPDRAIGRFRRNASGLRPQVMLMCGECHGTMGREIPEAFDAGTVRFQATTLTFSQCYKKSGNDSVFDCLSCHSPHQDAETKPEGYDAKCLSCHDPGPNVAGQALKLKICRVNSKKDCVSCHMPKIQSVQRHTKFTDHYIRKPQATGQ